jgi:hypothetical protein
MAGPITQLLAVGSTNRPLSELLLSHLANVKAA